MIQLYFRHSPGLWQEHTFVDGHNNDNDMNNITYVTGTMITYELDGNFNVVPAKSTQLA
jgi:hypothetical protein